MANNSARFSHQPERKTIGAINLVAALFIVATLASFAAPAMASASDRQEDIRMLKQAIADPGNTALLTRLNGEIEKRIASNPGFALHHYVHGWLLSHLGRYAKSAAAYDRASALDPTMSDAWYNAGVALAQLGRDKEALARWNSAIKADPKNVDAWYNAAQTYYNYHQFKSALAYWKKAQALTPNNFEINKKVLQAFNALHERMEAAQARTALITLWRNSQDPHTKALTEFCFDQRDVGKIHIYAYETFEPERKNGRIYTFRLADKNNHVIGLVTLEPARIGAVTGPPWLLGYTRRDRTHVNTNHTYTELPPFETLWSDVEATTRKQFADDVN